MLSESFSDVIWTADLDMRLTYVSPSIERLYGFKAEEAIGRHMAEMLTTDSYRLARAHFFKEFHEWYDTATGSGNLNRLELEHRCKDGATKWAEVVTTTVFDENGMLSGVMGVTRDISERKLAETALFQSENLFRTLTETVPAAIFIIKDERVEYSNPAGEEIAGLPLSELRKVHFSDFVHPDFRSLVRERGTNHLRGEWANSRYEFKILNPRLGERWLDFSATALEIDGEPAMLGAALDVTQRKEFETALRQSEERFTSFMKHFPGAAWIKDARGRLIFVNEAYARAYGQSENDLVGRMEQDLWPPSLADEFAERDARVASRGAVIEVVDQLPAQDGPHWWLTKKFPIFQKDDPPLIGGISVDVTKRKQAEEAMKKSEERYRFIAETASDTMWQADMEGRFTYLSPAFEAWSRYSVEEGLKMRFEELLSPESYREAMSLLGEKREDHLSRNRGPCQSVVLELEHINRYGRSIFCEANVKFILDETGRPVGLTGVTRDISGRKRVEEAVRSREETARVLLNATSDAAALMDNQKKVLIANDKFSQRFYPAGLDLSRMTIDDIAPPEYRDQYVKAVEKVLLTGNLVLMREEQADHYFENRFYPIFDHEGRVGRVAFFSRDMTLQIRAKEERQAYQNQLRLLASELAMAEERERRRLAEHLHDQIGQTLAYSLTRLRGLVDAVPDKEMRSSLDQITGLLQEAIKDTRSLTRDLSPPMLYDFGLGSAVEWLVDEVQRDHGLFVQTEIDEGEGSLDEDIRATIYRVVRELLINVVKHAQAATVRVSIRAYNRSVSCQVEDDGMGFEQPKQGARLAAGMGFGLFSIRERIEYLGGKFSIVSIPGKGTLVSFFLPLTRNVKTNGDQK
ncbi:MAG: PAS domain S-box protein [Proteobacteria bacterium]|nr:PAS domain S-box protein [Pseudomonadota bacterium]